MRLGVRLRTYYQGPTRGEMNFPLKITNFLYLIKKIRDWQSFLHFVKANYTRETKQKLEDSFKHTFHGLLFSPILHMGGKSTT